MTSSVFKSNKILRKFLNNFIFFYMNTRLLLLSCLLLIAGKLSAQEPMRMWTNREEKEIEARMLSSTDETVTLMLDNGRMFVVKLDTLTDTDQAYVKNARNPVPAIRRPRDGWFEDFDSAKVVASQENKKILMLFTGSDWCPPCMRLEKAVFEQDAFKEFAEEEVVLMKADFPRRRNLPRARQEANRALAQKYGVRGYPTLFLVDERGEVIDRLSTGARSPEDFIANLKPKLR